jgi:hypothetical protein
MCTRMMLSVLAATAVAWTAPAAWAEDLIAFDEFEYAATPNLYGANGGVGWAGQWFKLSDIPTGVSPQGLTWPGMITKGGTAVTAPYPSSGFTRYSRALDAYTDLDDTVYLSFLLDANPGYGVTAGLAFGTWENGMMVGMCPTGMYGLMTPPYTAHSDSAVPLVQGETALLVARIHRNADTTTSWSLYVNPAIGDPEPAAPEATLTVPFASLPPAVFLYNDGGFSTDEIRLGCTWSSVLPMAGDVTSDGLVNVEDLVLVITSWGPCPSPCDADLTGDGAVDVQDLVSVIVHWS